MSADGIDHASFDCSRSEYAPACPNMNLTFTLLHFGKEDISYDLTVATRWNCNF
jgi:hypothetical protein